MSAKRATQIDVSVFFNVRRVNDTLLTALHKNPSLTESLADWRIDFDPKNFEEEFFGAIPPEQRESSRASFEMRRDRHLAAQEEVLAPMQEAGLQRDDFGAALDLQRSWWGMESMIHTPVGQRLVKAEGEPIGEDVGYGPAVLFPPEELSAILRELECVTRDEAEPRFRAFEATDLDRRRQAGGNVLGPVTDEQFEERSWQPFCTLREFVAGTVAAGASLLVWFR
jgi:hypothetical protein